MLSVVLFYYSAISTATAAAAAAAGVLLLIAAAVVPCTYSFHSRVNQYSKRFWVKCTIDNNNNSSSNDNNYNEHSIIPQLAQPKHTDTQTTHEHTYIPARHMNERTKHRTNWMLLGCVYLCMYTHMVEKSGKARVFRNFNWMNNMRDAGACVCMCVLCMPSLTHTLATYLCCL